VLQLCEICRVSPPYSRIHGVACPQFADGGDGLQIWRLAANILNKQSRTTDKGWSYMEARCEYTEQEVADARQGVARYGVQLRIY
jgi:hypothetical protein